MHVADPVVNEEDLAAAIEFANHAATDQMIVPANDVGFDRTPFGRRCLEVADVTHANERHVQSSRDWSRG